jgi:hypothetical protein
LDMPLNPLTWNDWVGLYTYNWWTQTPSAHCRCSSYLIEYNPWTF